MNILQLNSSARRVQDGQGSYSTRLATELVAGLQAANSQSKLTVRDLGLNPHPAMDEAALGALFTPADKRSAEQAERVAANDALIDELFAADAIVIATPMINFGVPTQLKNWIDAVARAGTTFKYGATGPVGQVTGKKVYIVSASGGVHRGQVTDGVTPYLRTVLGFLGMTEVEFIYAEGLAMGPDAEAAGVAAARAQIAELLGGVTA
ncbi:FMN-dependent NADH-azoreductase [Pelomonas sp. KK5]|uniref:FMN-dependent NADH-azoreductase n=1 Tax=Pelomonas sp. KK5 TaxID=1855730 RepID=UPI00097C06F5|nr:NAD(P)H-dependent oxidoreductase [Pelomonas sp. KK5]